MKLNGRNAVFYVKFLLPCLCEIIQRIGVYWGVARDCPSVQRAFAAPDCTRAVTHMRALTAIFTRSVYHQH